MEAAKFVASRAEHFFYIRDKVDEIIANEQGFKLSPPLRECRGGEFFVDGGGSIDGDDR